MPSEKTPPDVALGGLADPETIRCRSWPIAFPPPIPGTASVRPSRRGRKRLARVLIRSLDDAWRIYLQPAVGGTRPDVVVIHPKAGIQIIEVKDYDMSAYDVSGKTWEVHTSGGLKTVRCPFRQADTARSALFRILLPPVEEMRAENKKGSDYQWNKIVRL